MADHRYEDIYTEGHPSRGRWFISEGVRYVGYLQTQVRGMCECGQRPLNIQLRRWVRPCDVCVSMGDSVEEGGAEE